MANDAPVTTASIFWVVAYLISLGGLIWIAIWSFFNNSLPGLVVAVIFFMMLVSSFVLSKKTLFQSGTWKQNATSFTLGFIIWSFIGGAKQSVLSVAQNNLFSTVSSQLPQLLEFIMNTFVIPIAEESLWIIAIPDVLHFVMDQIGTASSRFSFFKNKIVQLIAITIVGASTFALFHIGNLGFIAFLIAAMIFRSVMIFFVVGDSTLNSIPVITIVPAFAVGAHIGNNLAQYGFAKGVGLLAQNIGIGWLIFGLFIIIFLSAIDSIIGLVLRLFGKKTKVKL